MVSLATLIRWFPDRRGIVTAISLVGSGFGALTLGPITQRLIPTVGISKTFVVLESVCSGIMALAAAGMKNPPEMSTRLGFQSNSSRRARNTCQWYGLGLALLLNTAGIAIISRAAPIAHEMSQAAIAYSQRAVRAEPPVAGQF
jgi:OFA family oxalate/formate antiporter-like MFS transporter